MNQPRYFKVFVLSFGLLAGSYGSSASGEERAEPVVLDLKLGLESDSNAARSDRASARRDLLTRYSLKLSTRERLKGQQLSMTLRSGGKLYEEVSTEDTLLNQATLGYTAFPLYDEQTPSRWFVFTSGSLKDRTDRGSARDYVRGRGDIGTGARLGLLTMSGGVGYNYFGFKPNPTLSNHGLGVSVGLKVNVRDVWGARVGFRQQTKRFSTSKVLSSPDGLMLDDSAQRRDDVVVVSGGLSYQGLFVADLEFTYLSNTSNSYGQGITRQGVALSTTTPLFWDILLNSRLGIQRTTYADPLEVDEAIGVDEDNRNNVVLSLERPLYGAVRAEVRYALYTQEFGLESVDYNRQLVFAGLGVEY